MNKRMIVIPFFVLVMFSVSVSAQTGFYRAPVGKMGIGMGYQRYRPPKRTEAPFRFNAQTILGNLDYIFSSDLKVSLLPGISFFQANTQIPYEIAPSPSIDIRLLNVNDMNMTRVAVFYTRWFPNPVYEYCSEFGFATALRKYEPPGRCGFVTYA